MNCFSVISLFLRLFCHNAKHPDCSLQMKTLQLLISTLWKHQFAHRLNTVSQVSLCVLIHCYPYPNVYEMYSQCEKKLPLFPVVWEMDNCRLLLCKPWFLSLNVRFFLLRYVADETKNKVAELILSECQSNFSSGQFCSVLPCCEKLLCEANKATSFLNDKKKTFPKSEPNKSQNEALRANVTESEAATMRPPGCLLTTTFEHVCPSPQNIPHYSHSHK